MKRLHHSILGLASGFFVCLIAATPAMSAGGTGSGSPAAPSAPSASSGGDDVETVPIVRGETGSGFVLEGSWKDVQSLLREAQGPGAPRTFRTTDGGTVQVVYQGRFELRISKETLESGSVKVVPFGKGISVRRRNGDWIFRG